MDICGIYIGDMTLSYGTMRNSVYRDYEKFPYGTLENTRNSVIKDNYSKVQEKHQKLKILKPGKSVCPFCQEHKKRPLISYLKKQGMQRRHDSICEEDEEHNATNLPKSNEEIIKENK